MDTLAPLWSRRRLGSVLPIQCDLPFFRTMDFAMSVNCFNDQGCALNSDTLKLGGYRIDNTFSTGSRLEAAAKISKWKLPINHS